MAGPLTLAADWAIPSSAFASPACPGGAMSGVSAVSDGVKPADGRCGRRALPRPA